MLMSPSDKGPRCLDITGQFLVIVRGTIYRQSMHESTYFILLALHEQSRHGYGIAKRAGELSNGRVKLTAGTLYGALDRLVNQELIEVASEERVEGRLRRNYRIIPKGRKAAAAESQRMRSIVEVSEPIIGLGPAGAMA